MKSNFIHLKKTLVILLLITMGIGSSSAQYSFDLVEYTDSLKKLGEKILDGKSDFERFEANEKFRALLTFMISHGNATTYDFSSVKNLSALGNAEKTFRIFTWIIPKLDDSYECQGILYTFNERKKSFDIIQLQDVKYEVTNPDKKVFRKTDWYGALYYEIIPVKSNGTQYYTLLGWDGNNAMSTKKVIEVVTFNPTGQPTFGASLFTGYGKQPKRVIFEYSDNTQMVLRYERQAYTIKKKKNRKVRNPNPPPGQKELKSDGFRAITNEDEYYRIKRKSATMIIFDRLIPLNASLQNQYQFYVPETNIVDGFLFYKGRWQYVADVDARNAYRPQDDLPEKKVRNKVPPLTTN